MSVFAPASTSTSLVVLLPFAKNGLLSKRIEPAQMPATLLLAVAMGQLLCGWAPVPWEASPLGMRGDLQLLVEKTGTRFVYRDFGPPNKRYAMMDVPLPLQRAFMRSRPDVFARLLGWTAPVGASSLNDIRDLYFAYDAHVACHATASHEVADLMHPVSETVPFRP